MDAGRRSTFIPAWSLRSSPLPFSRLVSRASYAAGLTALIYVNGEKHAARASFGLIELEDSQGRVDEGVYRH